MERVRAVGPSWPLLALGAHYEHFLCTTPLQLGFKSGSSTTLCTALIKLIVSRYMNHGSKVFGCFLDASKAFDRVDHGLLFQKLQSRGFPSPILPFLISWYRMQHLQVQWNQNYFSDSFSVSNGVRQGSVLSPVHCLILVLGVIGDGCLLVQFVMRMMLFFWHLVHLHSESC